MKAGAILFGFMVLLFVASCSTGTYLTPYTPVMQSASPSVVVAKDNLAAKLDLIESPPPGGFSITNIGNATWYNLRITVTLNGYLYFNPANEQALAENRMPPKPKGAAISSAWYEFVNAAGIHLDPNAPVVPGTYPTVNVSAATSPSGPVTPIDVY